jgi:tight adherence protein C
MVFVWILAAVSVLALGAVLRWIFVRPKKQFLSPFQQSRSVPDRVTGADSERMSPAQASLLNLATKNSESRPPVVPSITPPPVPAFAGSSASGSAVSWSSPTSIPISSSMAQNRISTWNDRRLFSDFRGLLSEDAGNLPAPKPEDLPLAKEQLVFGALTPAIAQLLPETEARRELQRKSLVAAGYHSRESWINLTAVRFVLAFLSMAIVGFWLNVAPAALEAWLLALLIALPLLMWALPPLIVGYQAAERKIDIERGLPDVLDMMNMGVSQGLTVPQSLKRISREIAEAHPALAEELHIVNQQAEVGSLPKALKNFSQRIDSPEVSSFTSLLVQSETTGTSISRALTEYSDSIRASLRERADTQANAASFKLLFPVALFLMPSVFLFLLGPAIVQMSDFFNNQGQQLQQDRTNALRSLDQQPQLDLQRLTAPGGQLSNQP